MNYFTKEYIKECDCEEIQGLRPKIKIGDWYINKEFRNHISLWDESWGDIDSKRINPKIINWKKIIWLPTGDQLDEEIVRICKFHSYRYDVIHSMDNWEVFIHNDLAPNYERKHHIAFYKNPLIAKIKLLKELIK